MSWSLVGIFANGNLCLRYLCTYIFFVVARGSFHKTSNINARTGVYGVPAAHYIGTRLFFFLSVSPL